MCDCAFRVHPGFECMSDGCHCHDDEVMPLLVNGTKRGLMPELIVGALIAFVGVIIGAALAGLKHKE